MNKYFIINGEIQNVNNYNVDEISQELGVYEVIRVIDQIPLFAEEHIDRLFLSAESMDIEINISKENLLDKICELADLNKIVQQNIKLLFTPKGDSYLFFIDSFYPNQEMIDEGVRTVTYEVVRENPNIKYHDVARRKAINEYMRKFDAYEALLIDDEKRVVEGSRSNLFFIDGDKLITAPPASILMGVTRAKVLEICNELDIEVEQRYVYVDQIKNLDGLFLTSTSNNALPIKKVDEIEFSYNNNRLKEVLAAFREKMVEDLNKMKRLCQQRSKR